MHKIDGFFWAVFVRGYKVVSEKLQIGDKVCYNRLSSEIKGYIEQTVNGKVNGQKLQRSVIFAYQG